MESPPPLLSDHPQQQQNIKEEALFAPSDNAFGHGYQRQIGIDQLQAEHLETSDMVKNELIKLLLEMSPHEVLCFSLSPSLTLSLVSLYLCVSSRHSALSSLSLSLSAYLLWCTV